MSNTIEKVEGLPPVHVQDHADVNTSTYQNNGQSSTSTTSTFSPLTPQPPKAYAQPYSQGQEQNIQSGRITEKSQHPSSTTTNKSSSSKTQKTESKLLSNYLHQHPNHSVSKAVYTQFPQPNPIFRLIRRFKVKHSVINGLRKDEFDKLQLKGKELRKKAGWKFENEHEDASENDVIVGDLFWKMYISLLPTLERDPLSGLVPPDLLGSTTTMPLTIISLIPDIMQHYRDVIVRSEKEVFLATNYWQPSNSVNTISSALRELSARTIKAGKPKIIVKIMYDRGSWEQLWNAHAPVKPQEWAPLDLPTEEEVPGLDVEVVNFHRVLLGTFHAKFLIVDRKVALINSNNIQDRPNLEMMTHLEGPIVDSFYEVALHSWWNKLDPPLPCMNTPYQPPIINGRSQYLFQDHNPYFDDVEILKAAKAARILLRRQTKDILDEEKNSVAINTNTTSDRLREAVKKLIDEQKQSFNEWKPGEELEARAHIAMKELREFRDKWGLGGGAGTSSRNPSRGPSRGPSRRASQDIGLLRSHHKNDEDKTTITSTAYGSEATSSPTITNTEIPLKSKTYPLPNEPLSDEHWNSNHFPFNPSSATTTTSEQIHTNIINNGIPPSTPIRTNNNKMNLSDKSNSSRSRPNSIKEKEKEKKHVGFAPLKTDFDGSGHFLSDQISDKNNEITQSPIDFHFTSSPTTSFTSIPQSQPQPQPEARQNSLLGIEQHNQYKVPSNSIDTLSLGKEIPSPIRNEKGEILPLPLTATNSEETGDLYEKTKKHVEMNLTQSQSQIDNQSINPIQPQMEKRQRLQSNDSELQPEGTGSKRMFALSKKFNAGALSDAWATVEDSDELDEFKPHVVHKPHKPFPIAMTCRKPHGFPGHHDIRNPQNAAWLAGFRYAQKKVFVQTPTLNARPIVRAVKQACRRGVDVVLLLDLGFNDKGESIPFQGGTNEEVVDRLYKILKKDKKEGYLKVYWYTGKDQVRPLNAIKKQRNCHIKFAAYDDQVAIFGNGNQDSQSWFHSQEINVMIDSKQVVSEMMETLLSNQNTLKYGLVDSDGIWRDDQGHTLEHYGATAKGTFRGLSGFIAFAKTI